MKSKQKIHVVILYLSIIALLGVSIFNLNKVDNLQTDVKVLKERSIVNVDSSVIKTMQFKIDSLEQANDSLKNIKPKVITKNIINKVVDDAVMLKRDSIINKLQYKLDTYIGTFKYIFPHLTPNTPNDKYRYLDLDKVLSGIIAIQEDMKSKFIISYIKINDKLYDMQFDHIGIQFKRIKFKKYTNKTK